MRINLGSLEARARELQREKQERERKSGRRVPTRRGFTLWKQGQIGKTRPHLRMRSCLAAAAATFPMKSIPRDIPRTKQAHAERRQLSEAASTSTSHPQSRREAMLRLSSSLLFFSQPPRASASVPTKQLRPLKLQPPPPRDESSSVSIAQDATEAARLISLAKKQGLEGGDWAAARASFARAAGYRSSIASAELARVPAALALAELGKPEEALLELEDAVAEGSPALRGRAELHAALAALRYSLGRRGAEAELSAATLWEPRWADERWVKTRASVERGWPPTMVERLVRFLELN